MNIEQKIARLTLLINEYLKYTIWTNVGVTHMGDFIYVTWFTPVEKGETYMQNTIRKFPVEDLDSRLESYRNKINYEKSKRRKEHIKRNEIKQ